MCEIVSQEFLKANGFSLIEYPDGFFWVRKKTEDLVIQVNEARTYSDLWDNGWVEHNLTFEEIQTVIAYMDKPDVKEEIQL